MRDEYEQVTISTTALSTSIATDIIANNNKLYWNSTTNGSIFTTGSMSATGSLLVKSGITGALNLVSAGVPFMVSAGGLVLSTGSNGQITVSTTALSTSIATDINTNSTRITTLSGATAADVNELRGLVGGNSAWYLAPNLTVSTTSSVGITGSLIVKSGLTGALNKLPDGSDFLRGVQPIFTTTGSTGFVTLNYNESGKFTSYRNFTGTQLFLADSDNRTVLFVSNSAAIKVDIPSTLTEGFECLVVQGDLGQAEFRATGSLLYPSDFSPSSSQRYSSVSIMVSGTNKNAYLAGDLYLTPGANQTIDNILDSSGDRTLVNSDSGKVIFMSGSTNRVRVPTGLFNGFNVTLAQVTTTQILVLASASLKYPATFLSRSAEQNSMVVLYSGSSGLFMGGDMETA